MNYFFQIWWVKFMIQTERVQTDIDIDIDMYLL